MEPEEMVEKIIEEEFTERYLVDFYPTESGHAHDTFFVDFEDESFLVKINGLAELEEEPGRDWSDSFETEPYVLDLLRDKTDVPVPEPVARDSSQELIPEYYHILRKMEGDTPVIGFEGGFNYMRQSKKNRILRQLGENMARFHKVQFDSFGELRVKNRELKPEVREWPELFHYMISFWLEHLEDSEFEDLKPKIEEAVEENIGLIEDVEESVLVHREIDSKNILVDEGDLAAILDWEACIAGHREFDLVTAEGRLIEAAFRTDRTWEKYRENLYQKYRNVKSLDDGWRDRRPLYLLYPLTLEMTFFPDAGVSGEENIRRRVRKAINELPD